MNMTTIKIDAAFIPKEVCVAHDPICILIDAVRASCTIATFFKKGAREIVLIEDEKTYVDLHHAEMVDDCICAENLDGSRAALAEVSPSLEEINQFTGYEGRRVLFRTTNGTIGVRKVKSLGVKEIFIGSMLNCDAVAKAAVDLARKTGMNICTVCAGREHGDIYCIDDTYCAGVIIQSIEDYAHSIGCQIDVQDSAKIARSVVRQYANGEEAYKSSASGEIMRRINKGQDLVLCAQKNITDVVPHVARIDEDGNVVLTID